MVNTNFEGLGQIVINNTYYWILLQSVRPTRAVNRDADVMDVDMDHRGSVRDRSDHRLDRNSALVSTLSRSLADIPRAAPRAFAPERASLSDRMRGRLDQRQDPPCSVLVSNLHPNVSDSDINVSIVMRVISEVRGVYVLFF